MVMWAVMLDMMPRYKKRLDEMKKTKNEKGPYVFEGS